MMKIFSRKLLFCTVSKNYDKYLNDHIKKSLNAVSTPGKLKSKQTCQIYFQKLIIKPQSESNTKPRINMVFSAAFQLQNFDEQRKTVCDMILNQNIHTQSQLDRVIKFIFKQIKWNNGIGQKQIQLFLKQLQTKSKQFLTKIKQDLKKNSSQFNDKNANLLCKQYRQLFPQIDSKMIFDQVNSIVKNNKINPQTIQQNQTNQLHLHQQNKFWDKIHNIKPRLIKQQLNTPQTYQKHKQITSGKLRFRFPPQPNGYLHIGHIKSIRMNFQTAKRLGGQCYLRYDDTNPQRQTHQFIQEIQRNVKWMGYTPNKINFTSDYFQQMMEYANKLVKQGQAYVCESTQDQIQLERKQKLINPYRLKQKTYSQKIFPYLTPTQTLRLKLDPSSPNPTLRDPIIYRYKNHPHPKTGSKYTIYPMYDFAHCISDSIQHIDYSLCSLQFQIRRELYYKILDILGLYKPIVWQFSRLNVKGNVISKRKIKQLIDDKKIQGWDDPRLLTIKGMQRRGYTPKMLNQFIDKVNSSRSGNQKFIRFDNLQKQMKKQLSKNCTKIMALKSPVKINMLKDQLVQLIYLQKQQIEKLQNINQIILKGAGVFDIVKRQPLLSLKQSSKSIDEVKKQKQKIPILSWLPSDIIKINATFYETLLDENQQFNFNSRKQESLWVQAKFKDQINEINDENNVYLLQRIGYFKRDKKSGELICCTQV